MGTLCSSFCISIGCECFRTEAQKKAEGPDKMNEVTTSGKIGMEKSAIKNEYCEKYEINENRVAMWLDNRCTTSKVSEFIQSSGNDGNGNDNGGEALIMKENEIDMIIIRCRNIDDGYESNAESIDNDEYGDDDKYLTKLGWQMLCSLIEANSNTLRVIYFEGIFITRMRMEILCEKLENCKAIEEIAFIDCSINWDKDRHVETVIDQSDSQGREVEKRMYDGALMMLDATKDVESLMIVNLDNKETVSPEFEERIDNLVTQIKKSKKKFSFIY